MRLYRSKDRVCVLWQMTEFVTQQIMSVYTMRGSGLSAVLICPVSRTIPRTISIPIAQPDRRYAASSRFCTVSLTKPCTGRRYSATGFPRSPSTGLAPRSRTYPYRSKTPPMPRSIFCAQGIQDHRIRDAQRNGGQFSLTISREKGYRRAMREADYPSDVLYVRAASAAGRPAGRRNARAVITNYIGETLSDSRRGSAHTRGCGGRRVQLRA